MPTPDEDDDDISRDIAILRDTTNILRDPDTSPAEHEAAVEMNWAAAERNPHAPQ